MIRIHALRPLYCILFPVFVENQIGQPGSGTVLFPRWEYRKVWIWRRWRTTPSGPFRGYDSLDAFREHRLSFLDHLYERIDSEGYRPNAEAGHENPAAGENAFEDAYAHHLEPLIAIGREGEIIWAEGYHRMAIAAIQGLDAIPVQVLCRHTRWQRIRDSIAGAGGSLPGELAEYREHPDLGELTG